MRFTDAIANALDMPGRIVVEIGPGQTLSPLISMAQPATPPRAVLPAAPKPTERQSEMGYALAAVAGLWAQGVDVEWARLPGGIDGRRVSLPTYAFDRTHHWIEPGHGLAGMPNRTRGAGQVLARRTDIADWFETETWEDSRCRGPEPDLSGDWLCLPGMIPCRPRPGGLARVPGAEFRWFVPDLAMSRTRICSFSIRPTVADDYVAVLSGLGERLPERILCLWPLGATQVPFDSGFLLVRALQLADAGQGRKIVFRGERHIGGRRRCRDQPRWRCVVGPGSGRPA